MTRLNIPTGPAKADPAPLMQRLARAIAVWHECMGTMQLASRAIVDAGGGTALDEAYTAMWQACDCLDLATAELQEATKGMTDFQRAQIRVDRLAGAAIRNHKVSND